MPIISSGHTAFVSSGQVDLGDIVLSGGDLVVRFGGTAFRTLDAGVVVVGVDGLNLRYYGEQRRQGTCGGRRNC
jgi:hypothetical protein